MRLLLLAFIVFTFACTSQPTATDTPSHTETETSTWTDTTVPIEPSEAPQVPTVSITETATPSPTLTSSATYSPSPTETPSQTPSITPSKPPNSPFPTIATPSPTLTRTPTRTATKSPTPVTLTPIPNPAPSGTIVTTEAEFLSCISKANSTCIIVGKITLTKRTTIRTAGVTVLGFGSTALLTNSVANVYAVLEVVDTSNVTIRNIRIRRTPNIADGKGDGLSITRCNGCVVENISIAWSIDGGLDINTSQNVVVRNSIIAEPLRCSSHSEGCHSMGMLIFTSSNVLIQGNLFVSAKERNPRVVSSQNVTIRDNLIYNFGSHPTVISGDYAPSYVNYLDNKLIPGPDSPDIEYAVAVTNAISPVSVYVTYSPYVRSADRVRISSLPFGALGVSKPFDIEGVGSWPRDSTDLRLVECTVSRQCVIVDRVP